MVKDSLLKKMGTNLSIMVQIQADTYLEYWDTKSRTMNIYLAWIKKTF